MSTAPKDSVAPIALRQDEGEALWFLGFLATIKASSQTPAGALQSSSISRREARAPRCTCTVVRTNGFM